MKMKDRPFLPFYDLSFFPSIRVIITSNLADFKYVITFLKSSLKPKIVPQNWSKMPKMEKNHGFLYATEKRNNYHKNKNYAFLESESDEFFIL